jgi:hypothetical protein
MAAGGVRGRPGDRGQRAGRLEPQPDGQSEGAGEDRPGGVIGDRRGR